MNPSRAFAIALLLLPLAALQAQTPGTDAVPLTHPIVGPELPVQPVVSAPANSIERVTERHVSDAVSNGSEGLAVWQDSRSRLAPDIYAARINSFGERLDARAIRLTDTPLGEQSPWVSWSGASYVVAWQGFVSTEEQHIFANAVGIDGRLIGTQSLDVSRDGTIRGLASTGTVTGLLVTNTAGPQLSCAIYFLDTDGSPIRSIFVTAIAEDAAIASIAGGFQLILSHYDPSAMTTTFSGMRFTDKGVPIGSSSVLAAVLSPNGPLSMTVGGGADVVIAASRRASLTIIRVNGNVATRVTTHAVNVAETPDDITEASDGSFSLATTWTAAPGANSELLVRRFSAQDTIVGGPQSLSQSLYGPGSLLDLAGQPYAIWPGRWPESDGVNLVGSFYLGSGDPLLLSRSGAPEQSAALASSGSDALVAWTEGPPAGDGDRLLVRGVSSSGTPVGVTTQLSLDGTEAAQPAAAFIGNAYGVVWHETRDSTDPQVRTLLFRRLNRAGQPVDGEVIVSHDANPDASPGIASDGTNALVVWTNGPQQDSPPVLASLVTPARANTPSFVGGSRAPVVASNGSNFLTAAGGATAIISSVVTKSGAVISTKVVTTPGALVDSSPALATNGNEYLLVWERAGHIWAMLFDRNGAASGNEIGVTYSPIQDPPLFLNAERPSVAWDEAGWLVTWSQTANSTPGTYRDIYGKRLTASGLTFESAFPIARDQNDERGVATTSFGSGRVLAGYSRVTPDAEDVHRVFLRTITTGTGPSRRRAAKH